MSVSTGPQTRAERERAAYDEGAVWETSDRWHRRFPHVFTSPNSLRHERLFASLLTDAVRGKRVLEIGCGDGWHAQKLSDLGAGYVMGIDVAETFVAEAQKRAVPGVLEFQVGDAGDSVGGEFDAIVGRSVLHHIDYRDILPRLFENTLRPGGVMLFMEPIGGNILIKTFTRLVPKAHTPDERSFSREDLSWFQASFRGVSFYPFNYTSLPAGIVSSFVFRSPNNVLLRATDRFDVWLARTMPRMTSRFRQVVIAIRKPS